MVMQKSARQNAFGNEQHARVIRNCAFKPGLEAYCLAEFYIALGGNARCKHSRGNSARLQNKDLALCYIGIKNKLRHLGRFAAAGWRVEYQAVFFAQG